LGPKNLGNKIQLINDNKYLFTYTFSNPHKKKKINNNTNKLLAGMFLIIEYFNEIQLVPGTA